MTDTEIIKALEWCSDDSSDYCCELGRGCTDGSCMNELMKAALDLIQRQQERIDRLKDNLDAVLAERADHTEAIKEFADNLKKDIKNHRSEMYLNGLKGTHRTDEMTYETIIEYIDNLLEEMVGGSDDR